MTKTVTFAGTPPAWPTVRDRLIAAGHTPQMRMIDDMPAFPAEEPPADWKDIRLTLGGGMLTVRNEGAAWRIVVWGNADAVTLENQNAVAAACEELG